MRHIVLTVAILSIGSPALASSIMQLDYSGHSNSIVEKMCALCDKTPVAKKEDGVGIYRVPSLGTDVQRTEIREIAGQEKLVRTEGWWGGSPVTFVSNMPNWMTTSAQKADATLPVLSGPINTARAVPPSAPDGIDNEATTAAVGAQPGERAGTTPAEPQTFDGFSLRTE